jgi:hypothetical protein
MMTVEEKPDVTYADLGGVTDQIEKIREVVELPLLQPERFVQLGIDPPKGVLLFGPPGTLYVSISILSFFSSCLSLFHFPSFHFAMSFRHWKDFVGSRGCQSH